MTDFLFFITEVVWSSVLLWLLIGAGIWFTFCNGFVQFRSVTRLRFFLRNGSSPGSSGISSIQALCASLTARVGSGNLAGIALAISAGGPGSVFWMWVAAVLSMATAFAECSLAQLYKIRDNAGNYRGGPAWYMERGLGMRWMGVLFSVFLIVAFGMVFNAVQANTIAIAAHSAFDVPKVWVGIFLVTAIALVIWRGRRAMTRLFQWLVPLMALLWICLSLYVVGLHLERLPDVIRLIFSHAFGWHEAASGALGYTVSQAVINGFQRGMFSNEAGMGSTPNVAAAAWPPHPASQGVVQMFGVLIDTVIICTATAAIVLMSGMLDDTEISRSGIILVQQTFSAAVGDWGSGFIVVIVFLFAFTSIMANYTYAKHNLLFLNQDSRRLKCLLCLLVLTMMMFGTLAAMPLVWRLADVAMAIVAITNITAILLLSPVVKTIAADYLRQQKLGISPIFNPDRFPEIKSQLAPGVWDKHVQKKP